MKVKAADVFNAFSVLQKLGAEKMPIKGAMAVKLLVAAIHPQWKVLEDARGDKVKELGEPNPENPNMFRIPPDKANEYTAFFNELADADVEIEAPKLDLALLGERLEISAADLMALAPFVADEV